jgi:predicted RNase H-like nuclease
MASLKLIGADGCPGGWMVALDYQDHTELARWDTGHLGSVTRRNSVSAAVFDIPIGLPASGSRACDRAARRLLGRPRSSSVFPAPLRPMLAAESYQQAQRIRHSIDGKGCSRQSFGILPRVADVDELLRHHGAEHVYEGHPELAFQALAGGIPPAASKHTREGRLLRWQLLRPEFPALEQLDPQPASSGDSLDAYACLWTARRIVGGKASWVPAGEDELDPVLGAAMRIWF